MWISNAFAQAPAAGADAGGLMSFLPLSFDVCCFVFHHDSPSNEAR